MTGTTTRIGTILCATLLAACAARQAPAPLATATAATQTRVGPGTITQSSVVTAAATVVAIDQATRLVTLRAADGQEATIKVDPAVRNLAQVRRGDEVIATYYESVAVRLRPAGAEPGVSQRTDVARSEPGQRPAGAVAETTTIVATVTEIDHKDKSVTLRGADGKITTVDVQDPAHLAQVKVGDLVEVSVTQALAIQVERAPRRR